MVTIRLRVRHFKLLYSFLLDYPDKFPKLMERIKDAIGANGNNTLVDVTIIPETLEKLYAFVSSRPEGEMSTINAEMSQTMLYFLTGQDPQILSLAQEIATKENQLKTLIQQRVVDTIGVGGDVADALIRIGNIRERNSQFVASQIARAENYLNNIND